MKQTINIWMQLLGFEKNDPDRGAARFLKQTGFTPDSVCALLYHPDFVHLHRGMNEEYELYPDNCAYGAIPRNKERARQKWTNYDLRALIAALGERGVRFYAGIMGSYTNDIFHHEWLTDHPELRATSIRGPRTLMCLKRFADGTYYEDWFAAKCAEVLTDYGCAGIYLADRFCPSDHLYKSDYSTDMVEQFTAHTGLILPPEIAETMGDDSPAAASARQAFLWGRHRAAWIGFYEWRWERFFAKVCAAVHAAGKEVWILGMYCSDPFETRYVYGFDTARAMRAGVDCITANILPSSVTLEQPKFPYYFHRMHMDLPLLRTQIGNEHKIVTMVNVQDATEEWSVLDHFPLRLERDMYTMGSYLTRDADGVRPADDGFFFCLGDGIERRGWDFLKKRADIAFQTDAVAAISPMVLWSDTANDAMIEAYIESRRTSPHKQCFEVFKAGTPLAGALRSEHLADHDGVLFVPNYDLLSQKEKEALAAYGHPFVGTAPANYPLLELSCTYVCQDWFSDLPMKAFLCGADLSAEEREALDELLSADDGTESTAQAPEREVHPPVEEMPFTKLSRGFVQAIGKLLEAAVHTAFPVTTNCPVAAVRRADGGERLFLYNAYDNGYFNANVISETPIARAEVASAFPVLPVRYYTDGVDALAYDFDNPPTEKDRFRVKLAPDGVTIVDVYRQPAAKEE